jgi:hypothetical protein
MDKAPVTEMSPVFIEQGKPENLNNNIHVFVKQGEYYLAYVADSSQTITIDLPGETNYQMDVIDTWNMEISDRKIIEPGLLKYNTILPYTALRIISK